MKKPVQRVIHPLPPVYDQTSRVLILGSFPSVISREKAFYYANPNNRFWKVLAQVFECEITDRKQFCLDHHIALWDVIGSCLIHGSSDASIQDVRVNDITGLLSETKIHTIFTTGKKAYDLFQKHIETSIPVISLPSTSSANAGMKTEDLIRAYTVIRLEVMHEKD
ncbi:MAG: DNA-deoxyinosine glycosylase [Bulleidia sp.]